MTGYVDYAENWNVCAGSSNGNSNNNGDYVIMFISGRVAGLRCGQQWKSGGKIVNVKVAGEKDKNVGVKGRERERENNKCRTG